jgi:hypothetical protein
MPFFFIFLHLPPGEVDVYTAAHGHPDMPFEMAASLGLGLGLTCPLLKSMVLATASPVA